MPGPLRIDPIAEARRHWQQRWGDQPAQAMAAVTSIVRAHQLLLGRYEELLKPFGMTFARYELLQLLSFTRTGSLPVGKASERLQVHRSSVTNAVDKLAADGLVVRRAHPTDGRASLVEITDAGRTVAAEATAVLHAADFTIEVLDPDDRETLTRVLAKLRLDAGDFA